MLRSQVQVLACAPKICYSICDRKRRRYTGHTEDMSRRLNEHNEGKTLTARKGSGWYLLYKEEYASRGEAMKREKFLKSGKGRKLLKESINNLVRASA